MLDFLALFFIDLIFLKGNGDFKKFPFFESQSTEEYWLNPDESLSISGVFSREAQQHCDCRKDLWCQGRWPSHFKSVNFWNLGAWRVFFDAHCHKSHWVPHFFVSLGGMLPFRNWHVMLSFWSHLHSLVREQFPSKQTKTIGSYKTVMGYKVQHKE